MDGEDGRCRKSKLYAVFLKKNQRVWKHPNLASESYRCLCSLVQLLCFFKEKLSLSARLDEMMEQSLTLFQKRDDLDELEGFQQQELAKIKHMVRICEVE